MKILRVLAVSMLVLFTLCACSSRPTQPYVPVTQIVRVPVVVPCISELPVKPKFAVSEITEAYDLAAITDAYMVERHQRIIYEAQLLAASAGCVK